MKFMRKTIILAKTETTAGTDAVPTGGANAILARNVSLTPLDVKYVPRNIIRGFFGNYDSVVTSRVVRLAFEVEYQSSGTAGTAPAWGPLVTACGTTETLVAVTSAAYTPNSTNAKSLSMYVNIDGVLHKILYAKGDVEIKIKANDIAVLAFTFVGLDGGITDTAAPTPTYTGFITPLAITKANTLTATVHSIAVELEAFSMKFGNQIEQITRPNQESIQQTDRKSTGSVMFAMTSIATKDWFAAIKAATLAPIQIIHGSVGGNIMQHDASYVQLTQPQFSDQQGVQMVQLALLVNPSNAGNDEFTITAK